MDKRPKLNKDITVTDFKEFYWLKEELINFCRTENIDRKGGKIELSLRIEEYLKTGKKIKSDKNKKPTSKFDWNNEILNLNTIITDNYKNTENVRLFFSKHIGNHFKFNVKFMNWMKQNIGLNLEDAVIEWNKIRTDSKENKSPKSIAPQFEYNKYIRDFLKDNSNKTKAEAIEFWKIKKLMRGDNIYKKSDLRLK